MADGVISQITLPSGLTYEIKDTVARDGLNGVFVIAWNGTGTAVAANVPAGVKAGTVTGTLAASAATAKKIYLVRTSTEQNPTASDIYDEYITVQGGTTSSPTYSWEKIGDTQIKLTEIVTGVTLNKQTTDFVTGYNSPTSTSVVGANATFTVTQPVVKVTPSTTYIKTSTDSGTFLKNVTANTSKLETTTISGVSGSVTASKVSADTDQTTAKGTGTASTSTDAWLKGWSVSGETLTLNGVTMDTQTTKQIKIDTASVTVPKAATAIRVATGNLDTDDANGAQIATGVTISGTGYTGTAITSVGLATDTATATGRVQVATGTQVTGSLTTNVGVSWADQKNQTVLTGLGTASKAAGLNNSTTIEVTKPT